MAWRTPGLAENSERSTGADAGLVSYAGVVRCAPPNRLTLLVLGVQAQAQGVGAVLLDLAGHVPTAWRSEASLGSRPAPGRACWRLSSTWKAFARRQAWRSARSRISRRSEAAQGGILAVPCPDFRAQQVVLGLGPRCAGGAAAARTVAELSWNCSAGASFCARASSIQPAQRAGIGLRPDCVWLCQEALVGQQRSTYAPCGAEGP